MTTCQRELMKMGRMYPRTCELCGLFGPCKKGHVAFSPNVEAPTNEELKSALVKENESLTDKLDRLAAELDKTNSMLQRLITRLN